MTKYSEELTDKIVSLIEEDNYPIVEICKIVGISRKMYYEWINTKPGFERALNEAKESREEKLRYEARKSIREKLAGHKKIETKTVYTTDKDSEDPDRLIIKEYTVKEKFCQPETSTISLAFSGNISEVKELSRSPSNSPLTIIVQDEETKRQIEILQQNSKNNDRNIDY